ncbi:MAG: PKD domain-containing protein [Salinivirgaceae bacterium]|nr:PKD domain-containing protein [Salinivirgaceae bacterium]
MRKTYLILTLLFSAGITFAQEAKIQKAPVEKSESGVSLTNRGMNSNSKEINGDFFCADGSLFANNYVDDYNSRISDGARIAGTDFATIGGDIETLKFWGFTAYPSSNWDPCDNSDNLFVDINFYVDYAALLAGTPAHFFADVPTTPTLTDEVYALKYPVYEWDVILPSAVSLSSGIITIKGNGNATPTDCSFLWVGVESGFGQAYYKPTSGIWKTDSKYQHPICMGGTAAACKIPCYITASNITNASADISWTETGTANRWQYEVVEAGTIPTGAGTDLTAPNVSLSGLTTDTEYIVYVRADCGAGSYSEWSAPYSFRTVACDAANQCAYEFILNDSYADGWNDAWLSVSQGGIEIAYITLDTGSTETLYIPICDAQTVELVWKESVFDYEISFTINDPFGAEVYSIGSASPLITGVIFHTFTSSCNPPAPVAAFSGTPLTICVGETVTFTDASTNTPTSWLWNFGDAGTSDIQNPTHTYNTPGNYTVTLTATNASGSDSEIKTAYITVNNTPVVGFTIDATSAPTIDFTNTTVGADSYSWDLGDGSPLETTTDATHDYSANNTYTVILSATNGCGTETSEQTVTIVNVGIEGLDKDNIKIYPNPAETAINIQLPTENVEIQLVNMDGKLLKTIQTKDAKQIEINVEDLAKGIYNLIITTQNKKQVVVKVVKK